jgi:hypothetical protein
MISWFAYVPHEDITAREALGWIVVGDLGPVHGAWSVLMRWDGPGAPHGGSDARA